MAGDWIKMEMSTPDKPEVWGIANALGIDPDAVVGKLFRVWSWFDQHTENGHAPSVTKNLLDRAVGVTGFCNEVVRVGWLTDDGTTLVMVNFERHNGKGAKNRALAAERKRAERSRSERDKSVTREEKRRIEKKVTKKSATKFTKPTVDQVREYTQTRDIKIDPQRFVDYYEANGWKVGRNPMKDWKAAVRTWEQRHQPNDTSAKHSTVSQFPARKKENLNDYL